MRAWLDSEFEARNAPKRGQVVRGMMIADVNGDNDPAKKRENGEYKRKIHPKYASVSEHRPPTPEQELHLIVEAEETEAHEEVAEDIVRTGKKRKREDIEEEISLARLPMKRSRTGRWDWVEKWLPRWVTDMFGFTH